MTLFVGRHDNKIDTKGRVSVPKPFRASLQAEGSQKLYAYPLFKYAAIEACGEDFMARLSVSLDDLDMFSDEQDDLAAIFQYGLREVPGGAVSSDEAAALPGASMGAAGRRAPRPVFAFGRGWPRRLPG